MMRKAHTMQLLHTSYTRHGKAGTNHTCTSHFKTSAKESLVLHELKQHKPWCDEECLGFFDQKKQGKVQWVQDPSQNNVDNLNSVRHEATRHFRNKKKECLKSKVEEL